MSDAGSVNGIACEKPAGPPPPMSMLPANESNDVGVHTAPAPPIAEFDVCGEKLHPACAVSVSLGLDSILSRSWIVL